MVNNILESLERLAMPDDLHIKECERLGISNSYDYDLIKRKLEAFQLLKEMLLLEVREIGGIYYIKYFNREDGNYIDCEISQDVYEVLRW